MDELLGSRIKALRIAKNFTQEQIADQIGVSRQIYASIENGTDNVTLDILSRIVEVLDVAVKDITKVLDKDPVVSYKEEDEEVSSAKIFDMINLFYANKHLYKKLRSKNN